MHVHRVSAHFEASQAIFHLSSTSFRPRSRLAAALGQRPGHALEAVHVLRRAMRMAHGPVLRDSHPFISSQSHSKPYNIYIVVYIHIFYVRV